VPATVLTLLCISVNRPTILLVLPATRQMAYSAGTRSAQISQKSRTRHKVLIARVVTPSEFHTEHTQLLCSFVHKFVARVIWLLGLVHVSPKPLLTENIKFVE